MLFCKVKGKKKIRLIFTSEHHKYAVAKGKVLSKLRFDEGYKTAGDFAEAVTMDKNTYASYEAGKNMTAFPLQTILNKLNITHSEFYAMVDKSQGITPLRTLQKEMAENVTSN